MNVAVFGGSGFLGSHVADILSESGHNVTVYDLRASPYLKPSQTMVLGSILDQDKVERIVKGCDVVYNFAGIADIDDAGLRPLDAVRSNVLGTCILLEACRKAEIRRFVFASSLYVYSRAGSFYKSTKQSCELFIEDYKELFGIPFTILRYGSLYGPRADSKNFIQNAIRQAITDGRIVREGDGEEIREYIHVYDAAKGSVEILSDEYINQYVMLTGNQQVKVKELLLMIKEMLNDRVELQYITPKSNLHYEITPYNFAPKIARKLVSRSYLDLGQGILDSIESIYKEVNQIPDYGGLLVSERD